MLLIRYTDNPMFLWGYDQDTCGYDVEDRYGIMYIQTLDESRDKFFERVGEKPTVNEFGYDSKKDYNIIIGLHDYKDGYGIQRGLHGTAYDRCCIAQNGIALDYLINDKADIVRAEVARQNFGLDVLINDDSFSVRYAVASVGYGLDKLINDKSDYVRAEVARQGYGLYKLINDSSSDVRMVVAEQGYGLEKLVNDESENVRIEVASKGYGLDKLINDESCFVRAEVAKQGYRLDKLVKDQEIAVRMNVYLQNYGIEDYLPEDRGILYNEQMDLVNDGIGLNIFYNSEYDNIRSAVVEREFNLKWFCENEKAVSIQEKLLRIINSNKDYLELLKYVNIENIKNGTIAYMYLVIVSKNIKTIAKDKDFAQKLLNDIKYLKTLDERDDIEICCKYIKSNIKI